MCGFLKLELLKKQSWR